MVFVFESLSPESIVNVITTQLALVIFPFFSITVYLLLLWIRGLVEKPAPKWLKILYWGSQCVLFSYVVDKKIAVRPASGSWISTAAFNS